MIDAKRFCKIYESNDYGQILVRLDTNDDGEPCIVITVNMNYMYVSSSLSGFKDGATDDELLQKFDSIGMKECESFAESVSEMLNK